MAIVMETIQHKFNWFSLVVGVILFVAGIVTFIHLGTTLEFISIIIGATAVVKGYGSSTFLIRRPKKRRLVF